MDITATIKQFTGLTIQQMEDRLVEYCDRDLVRPEDRTFYITKAGMIAASQAGIPYGFIKRSEDIPAICYMACAYGAGPLISLFLPWLGSDEMKVTISGNRMYLTDGSAEPVLIPKLQK